MTAADCMDLWAVTPELALAGLALALLPFAGFARGRWQRIPSYAVAVGLVVSIALSARMLAWPASTAFCGTYAVDRFASVYKLLVEGSALIALPLLAAHLRGHRNEAQAPVALLLATVGGLGLVSSLDLALVLLFLQLVSLPSYLLVVMVRSDPRAQEAALKYFVYAAAALAIMAYGLTFLYGLAGSLDLREIGARMAGADRVWLVVALGLVFVGYAFEITAAPFHFWAPDVYEGTTAPVAAFISVVPKIAAFAGLLRLLGEGLVAVPGSWQWLTASIAVLSMIIGNLLALSQQRMKRLLAYSSIAQAGYMLVAVAVLTRSADALPAIGFYLAAYALMNLGAFVVVAQLERTLGTDTRRALRGLARRSPVAAAVLAIALLSLAGIPPFAGFAGKVFLLSAAMSGGMTWLAVVAAVNMLVALYYYVAIVADMFFASPARTEPLAPRAGYLVAAGLATAGTIALGVTPDVALALARMGEMVR